MGLCSVVGVVSTFGVRVSSWYPLGLFFILGCVCTARGLFGRICFTTICSNGLRFWVEIFFLE